MLFGIGGDVQGGLFDAFQNDDGDANEQVQEERDKAKSAVDANPRNAAMWATLARTETQLATGSEGFNETSGAFEGDARKHLVAAKAAWDRHLALAGEKPDGDTAAIMRSFLGALNDDAGAVRAQEAYIDSLGDKAAAGDFGSLAQLAYTAGQTRKGDLAAERAVELSPKDERKDVKEQLDQMKAQVALQESQTSTAPTATAPAG